MRLLADYLERNPDPCSTAKVAVGGSSWVLPKWADRQGNSARELEHTRKEAHICQSHSQSWRSPRYSSRRMREPGRISEQSSIQCDADGSGPRTIRDELSTGHPGHYFARSRAARPPRALDEWDPTGRIHDRRHRLRQTRNVCRHLSAIWGWLFCRWPRPIPRLAIGVIAPKGREEGGHVDRP